MEDIKKDEKTLTLANLLNLSNPITGTSSLNLNPNPNFKTLKKSLNPKTPISQNPNFKTLKPLNQKITLSGTLKLPTFEKNSSSPNSFIFTDESCSVICDIIDFDIRVIGNKINVLAWNFLPLKSSKNGFLEIIKWEFVEFESSLLNSDIFYLEKNAIFLDNSENDKKSRFSLKGALVSISPISIVPCNLTKICGFLANILTCGCKLCKTKVSGLNDIHSYTESEIVYFFGYNASSWYPAIVKLVGNVISFANLKKKLVFIGNEESQLMYVTSEKTSLCLPKLVEKWVPISKNVVKGKGECGTYIGSITGIYMNGMVVELDEKVMLVVTDQQIGLPHSVRIGAIVSIRNVHYVNPIFSWTKILILGACFKSSICLEAFSPLETGCCMYSQSQSLLGNFIDSLVYSARLWVLLLISSFRKKFAGIFSEHEILGSKHKEGLVQRYATSHLPSSVFRSRHGLFKEYCNHDAFCCNKEPNDVQLKLVAPISSVINHCNATRMKLFKQQDADSEVTYDSDQRDSFFCEGLYYRQSARSILQSNEINVVLLGLVKMSTSSGRLQLIDTTGSIDVLIPDLHSTWTVKNIYEVNDFTVVMEGVPEQSHGLVTMSVGAFSCRSIFTGVPCRKNVKVEMYILFHFRDTNLLVHPFSPMVQDNRNFAELQSGMFHILLVTHKYLLKQNFQGEPVITNSSSVFAEALLLPWDLCLQGKDDHPSKRMKTDKGSSGEHISRLTNSGITNAASRGLHRCTDLSSSSGIPCSVTYRNLNNQFSTISAILSDSNSIVKVGSREKPRAHKLLVEFKYESFCKYELLKVGGYYIIKHHKEDFLCSSNAISHVNCNKVIINLTSHLWSSSFSSNHLHSNGYVCDLPSSVELTDETLIKCHLQNGLPVPQDKCDFSQIQSEVTIHLQNSDLEFLKDNLKSLDGNLMKPITSLKEVADFSWSNEMNGSVQAPVNLADYQLPEGNLISIRGKVLSIHECGCTASSRLQSDFRMGHTFKAGKSVCIHVLVDDHPVRVIGLSCNHAYPVGFGPGCIADFHRILVLSGRNKLTMTLSSYIQIKRITLSAQEQCKDDNQPVPSDCTALSAYSMPSVLISEITQPADSKPVQFQCRIVAIYMLLMETTRKATYPQTSSHTRSSVFQIPLAGFVLDDGSSSSCFWASNEVAFTLLRLNEKISHELARNTTRAKKSSKEGDCKSVVHHVGKIVKKHGVVTVRNYGSVYDSTSQDLMLSVTSNSVINNPDEGFLKGVILNACFGTCWTVIGSLMDSRALGKLEKQLADMDMTMHPMRNIWVQEVHHISPLLEARRVMQELLN